MTNVGRLEAVLPDAFLLSNAVWIAVTDRFRTYCTEGKARDIEPFDPNRPVFVNKAAVIDITTFPCIPTDSDS